MKIAIIAKKGGVGKTTLCILLHEALKQTGQSVAVRDYDSQGSASKSLARINGTRETPGAKYDILLIDTPPSLTLPATPAAVSEAQIILIPTSPSPLDLWEAEEAAQFSRSKNPKAVIRFVLNKIKTNTILADSAASQLSQLSAPVLTTSLVDRQSYQHASLTGWDSLDTKAQTELLQFTVAVTSLR